jgi:hypothetical protein
MPQMASMMSDIVPIWRSGLSVRCPASAAVGSPCFSAVQACMNSWQQIEKTTTSSQVKKSCGLLNR